MTLQTLLNVRSVLAVFGNRGLLAGVLFLAVGFVVGWALGGAATDTRSVLGLGTAQRNIAAALVVANQSFDDPNVVVMVVVIAIVGLFDLDRRRAHSGRDDLQRRRSLRSAEGRGHIHFHFAEGQRRYC